MGDRTCRKSRMEVVVQPTTEELMHNELLNWSATVTIRADMGGSDSGRTSPASIALSFTLRNT